MIEGSLADASFACSGGTFIPGKYLSLGLTVKSSTRSKTIFSLLNQFSYCPSDETIKKIDLALDETVLKTKTLVPSHIIRKSNIYTGLALDNFAINI